MWRLLFSVFANVVKMTDLLKLYLVHEMFRKLQQANDHRQCQLLNFPDVLFCVLWFKLSYFHENEAQNQWQRTWNDANTEPEQKNIHIYKIQKKNKQKKNTRQTHFRSRHFRKPVQSSHQPIIFKKHWFEKEHDKDARACLFANKTANWRDNEISTFTV